MTTAQHRTLQYLQPRYRFYFYVHVRPLRLQTVSECSIQRRRHTQRSHRRPCLLRGHIRQAPLYNKDSLCGLTTLISKDTAIIPAYVANVLSETSTKSLQQTKRFYVIGGVGDIPLPGFKNLRAFDCYYVKREQALVLSIRNVEEVVRRVCGFC